MNDRPAADTVPTRARDRLLAAGMEVMESRPIAKVAGASVAEIARRAGVTTGSFFHHFPSAADFADAMVFSLLEQQGDQIESVDELLDAVPHLDLLGSIRQSLWEVWQVFSSDRAIERRLRCQMIMWAHHDQPLHRTTDDIAVVGDMLRKNYDQLESASVRGWEYLLHRTGRTVVEPFTVELLATTLTAVLDGLRIRHAVQPERVPDELFAEIGAALTAVVTAPRGGRVRVEDLDELLIDQSRLSPQARSGARRRRDTRRRITTSAVGMFDSGWESVPASEVAQRAGVSNQTVLNLFGTVRGVAASTFVRHVPAIRTAAAPVPDDAPVAVIERALRATSIAATADPEAARALLDERLAVVLRRGSELADMDVRLEVPLADSLLKPLAELDLGVEPIQIASMLINFVLAQSVLQPDAGSEVARTALRLLPGARD